MGPQCTGISDLTDNPVGMVGLSTSNNVPRPQALITHPSLPYCSALMYSLSTGLQSTLPTCTPSRTSSKRRPRFSPVMVSRVPPCRGPVSGDSCRKAEAVVDIARSTMPGGRRLWVGLQGWGFGRYWTGSLAPTLRILGSVQRLLPWWACIQEVGESAGQWWRREQRRSATHQPHSKRGSALRQRPQLWRKAGHL